MYTVVSLSLGYHWKMDIWYLNTVQLHWVTVNLACIMMTTQSEDMRCDESRAVTGFILFSYNPYVQVMRMYQVSWEGRVCAGTAPSPVRSVRQITPSARCAPDSSLVSTAAISHTTTTWSPALSAVLWGRGLWWWHSGNIDLRFELADVFTTERSMK